MEVMSDGGVWQDFWDTLKEEREPLQEMARLCKMQSGRMGLKKGMIIEVVTREYQGTCEEPHFHLYPASHKFGDKSDLITRVRITQKRPLKAEQVMAIADNTDVPYEYKEAIVAWAQQRDSFGDNNWESVKKLWNQTQDGKMVFTPEK